MAKNLRSKIPKDATLYVCEINEQRRDEFIKDTPGDIRVLKTPADVMKHSVSGINFPQLFDAKADGEI